MTPLPRPCAALLALTLSMTLMACATAPMPQRAPVVEMTTPKVSDSAAALSVAASISVAMPEPGVAAAPQVAPTAAAMPVATPAPEAESATTLVDPLRPEVRIDPNDANAQSDLWARARQGFRMPDLDNDLVRKWEQYYSSKPEYLKRMFERGGRYLFHIVDELERRQMPTDLALLPFIESAFNPQAMSSAKASGMWQFIPGTGRDFSLKQNVFRDDRRDVLASTRAALDYLAQLNTMFNDWQLALAAYNWGQGSVQRAITRNGKQGQATGYEQLAMPAETRNYVPKLQAIKNIVARPEAFGLTLPPLLNHPYFLAVPIQNDIDVDLAAKLAGLPLEEFKQLNPQMNKPVILAAGTPRVLLPYDAANHFVRALPLHKGALASWTAWVAPKTLRPAEVARQVGMSEPQLREINHIPPGMVVKAGSTLLVPRHGQRHEDVSGQVADAGMLTLARDGPALRRVTLKAGKRGSSVAALAKQYRVSATQVALWNGVAVNASFKAGQSMVVMVPGKASAHAKHRGAAATKVASAAGHRRAGRSGASARRRG